MINKDSMIVTLEFVGLVLAGLTVVAVLRTTFHTESRSSQLRASQGISSSGLNIVIPRVEGDVEYVYESR
jgi:hypothetical protein